MGLVVSQLCNAGAQLKNKVKMRTKPSSPLIKREDYDTKNLDVIYLDQNMTLFINKMKPFPRASTSRTELTNPSSEHGRPLVVLFAWITAQNKHLRKFCDFYTVRGFDILIVKSTLWQLLRPTTGCQVIADNLVDYLANSGYEDILVHAFSMGGYLFGECLIKLKENLKDAKYKRVKDSIKGLVFDSIIDYQQTAKAMPKTLLSNPVLQYVLEHAIQSCLWMFYFSVTVHYIKSSQHFHDMFLSSPILTLVSKNDELDNFESNVNMAKRWKELGKDVVWKCWEKSKHVRHFIDYPEEYGALVDKLLVKSGIRCRLPRDLTSTEAKVAQ